MKILIIIAVVVILPLVMFGPMLIGTYRDFSNLREGAKVYVRVRDDLGCQPNNYKEAIVCTDRQVGRKDHIAYLVGYISSRFGFFDMLRMKVITEERFDTLFD